MRTALPALCLAVLAAPASAALGSLRDAAGVYFGDAGGGYPADLAGKAFSGR